MEAPIAQQPNKMASPLANDQLLLQKLANINKYTLRQGSPLLEAVSCGALGNIYVLADAERKVQVQGRNEEVPIPVFVVKEESNCCLRLCCGGHQALVARMYHANMQPKAGKEVCGIYSGHVYEADPESGVAMTMDRDGCCHPRKFGLGCFVCFACCQDEMFMHAGGPDIKPGDTRAEDTTWMSRSAVPIGGGGFHPTFEFTTQDNKEEPFAYASGPCCFGGWMEFFRETVFKYTTNKDDEEANLAELRKKTPKSIGELCAALMTPVDYYEIDIKDDFRKLSPEQQMTILGNGIHVDYMLFENDKGACGLSTDSQGNPKCDCVCTTLSSTPIHARQRNAVPSHLPVCLFLFRWFLPTSLALQTLCLMYCAGCVMPCTISCVFKSDDS
ncbi:uncharacterized protein MONBRDRAFT_24199 [Monosiga brevicollis MX1]|uniref:Phospholipid scramblase n=1 Tax=Monosiga brevicollis TaxID=81824 RepID=A9UVP8_MONBE|nr:uncharacterized protein MONBRDRAFT_24199 [Monosiga brevicollis MX1]EDQ90623.1 predicted protein [Monosiga brevicollis MX1]|eukprot:XP_001744674.1 hypothetical protein [Monosiga brevicollis MX1]